MKKFILFNSPIFWDATKEKEQYLSPLGLGYIATYLEKAGIDVTIVDCVKERKSVNDIVDFINKTHTDYIGINIFTQNYEMVKYIIESITITCDCFIGGQVVKGIYLDILRWNTQNRLNIIIGEGEFIIPALVSGRCKQIPEQENDQKVVYRVNKNSEYFPKDISNIFLNRKYLGNEIIYNHYGEKEIAIITSRGCAFDCAFCGGAKSLNKDITTRIRTEESVITEIREILSAYPDIQSIRVLDDLFLRNGKSIDMTNNIFLKFPHLSWRGMVHVLSLAKDVEKVKKLRRGRCRELFIGIESGSESVRRKINKLGTIDDIITVSKAILESGIDLKGYFIYGFPGETKEDFQKTYELASKIKEISTNTTGTFRTSVFQFRPYHGTQLYNEIVKSTGIIHECEFNQSISKFEGRSQFNFDFGNYSKEKDEILNQYIIKTQELTKEEK
ncbi:B12-binding domain-containing radical SAM protein [Anaerobutyricum hallii]|uniref:B12-binding domain-containing radical SAM protein n=1 Tax=Anaerobutyricum hallii TaxID=39488 RepID=UPI00399CEF0F